MTESLIMLTNSTFLGLPEPDITEINLKKILIIPTRTVDQRLLAKRTNLI